VQKTTIIELNLLDLSFGARDHDLVKLVMNEIERSGKEKAIRDENDNTNLPTATLLDVFKNVKQIKISTTTGWGGWFSISLLSLLKLIKDRPQITEIEVGSLKKDWIDILWSSQEKNRIVSAYKKQNYGIALEKNSKENSRVCRLLIRKET